MPPKNKKARTTASTNMKTKADDVNNKTPVKSRVVAEPAQPQEEDFFTLIGPNLHMEILSFLLAGNKKNKQEEGRKASRILAENIRNVPRVSTVWRELAGIVMNQQAAAPHQVVSPRELFEIKAKVARLDLAPICTNFIKDVHEKWGHVMIVDPHDEEEISALTLLIDHVEVDLEGFAELVQAEYRMFLVVKCVEKIASDKAEAAGVQEEVQEVVKTWTEKGMPSKLIDIFWHSHMLSPKKYAEDCELLIGEIIDHDAGYVSASLQEGSDGGSKRKALFQFEEKVQQGIGIFNYEVGILLLAKSFNLKEYAWNILDDMIGDMMVENDCG